MFLGDGLRRIIKPKYIWLIGIMVMSSFLLYHVPRVDAAEYSIRFGKLQGSDHKTVAPTTNIKLCNRSTGYQFGYEIVPQSTDSYEYYTILYLPTPPATVGPGMKNPAISEGGKEIKMQAKRASGPAVQSFVFDAGDPTGPWKFDVVVQDSVVATIKFDVVRPRCSIGLLARSPALHESRRSA